MWKACVLARALMNRQGRQDHLRAKALMGRVVEKCPREPFVQAMSALVHIVEGWRRWSPDPDDSLRGGELILRRLRMRYGDDAPGTVLLPWVCALRGETAEAVRHARKYVDSMPENFLCHAYLGIPLLYAGRMRRPLTG